MRELKKQYSDIKYIQLIKRGTDAMPGILVVEDDENLNRGITFSLKKSGYVLFSDNTSQDTFPVPVLYNDGVHSCRHSRVWKPHNTYAL